MSKIIVPAVPNTGRHNSCHINSCHMILQYRGENVPLPKFIPMSSFTFGFLYVNNGKFVLPAVSGCPCRDCMSFVVEQLGYDSAVFSDEDPGAVFKKVKEIIDSGNPLVAGPLPMDLYQKNNPQAPSTGLDSFCVVCGYDEDEGLIFLTDTFGLGYMPVPIEEFEAGWKKGKRLCPNELIAETPFLFEVGEKRSNWDEQTVVRNTLCRAYELGKGKTLSGSVSLGIEGLRRFSEDLDRGFGLDSEKHPAIITTIRDFTFLIGAQSRGDIVYFLNEFAANLPDNYEKGQVLRLMGVYKEELTLFMDGLRVCSEALDGQKEGQTDSLFSSIKRQVGGVIGIEEEALGILETFAS